VAAILFGVALLLNLLSIGRFAEALTLAGLLCLALHTIGVGVAWGRRG
jgi:hypothetical protein